MWFWRAATVGVKDDRVLEKFVGKRDLDLDGAMKTIKQSQVTHSQATEISKEFSAKWGKSRNPSEKKKMSCCKHPSKDSRIKSGTHAPERKSCEALGQKCKKCGKECLIICVTKFSR